MQEFDPEWNLASYDQHISRHSEVIKHDDPTQEPESEAAPIDEVLNEVLPEIQPVDADGAELPDEKPLETESIKEETESEQLPLEQKDNVKEEELLQLQEAQSDNLHAMVAGLAGWGLATGQRQDNKQRINSKDLHRFSNPEIRNWRWSDGQLQKEGKETPLGWDTSRENLPGFIIEKNQAQDKPLNLSSEQ